MGESLELDLNGPEDGTAMTATWSEGDAAGALAPEAVLSGAADFAGASLTVSFASGGSAGDRVFILGGGGGEVGAANGEVTFQGVKIATYAGGEDGAALVIALETVATPDAVQALLRAISFENGSDEPSDAPRDMHFLFTAGDGTAAGADLALTVTGDGIATIPVVADGTDQSALINAFMTESSATTFKLPAGEFAISASIFIPEGKALIGAGQDLTTIKVLPSFGPLPGFGAITVLDGSTLSDLTVDVAKTNNGLGAALRVSGVIGHGDDFHVENVTSKNVTGYAFWANAKDYTGADPVSGTFLNCHSENAGVHYETTRADGVLFEGCTAADGDGDIPSYSVFHPGGASSNITFLNCSYIGQAQAVNVLSMIEDQVNIVFDNVYGETLGGAVAVWIEGPFTNEVIFRNSSFIAHNNNGMHIFNGTVYAENSSFSGVAIGVYSDYGGSVHAIDSSATARAPGTGDLSAFALYGGSFTWEGGVLSATGRSAAALDGAGTISGTTTVIVSDSVYTDEATSVVVDVTANDADGSGAALHVTSIEGPEVSQGQTITLASGAIVTMQADGKVFWAPGGAFDSLPPTGAGAANS